MAVKMGAPVIGLVDCAGLRLQEATDALNGFGEMYLSQTMASGVVPQISAIFGTCGGGMAVASAMADFIFMEEKNAKLFVNSPNAIDGNRVEKCDTSSATFQSEETGLVDFLEVKKNYDKSMVTGFIRLNGTTVGCVANRTAVYAADGVKEDEFDAVLSANGAEKAAKFVSFCDAFNIPLLTLVNVKGYKACKCTERRIAKNAGRLTYAFANASVPKVTVVVGEAYGTAYLTMNSKSIGADVVYAWPNATIGMMDASAAAKIMYADEIAKADDSVALINEKAAAYREMQSSALAAAKRGYVDDIIEACDTRKRVIAAFEMLFTKREDRPDRKHGTV